MDLSVIIVSYNTKDLLKSCLESLYKFTKTINFETIIVDNDSKDSSVKMVSKYFPNSKIIKNNQNLGFSKANNQGIKAASGDYILLLNSDTYLIENSLEKLVNIARQKEKLGVLGPKLLNPDKSIQQSVGFFPHLPQIFYWMSFIDDLPFGLRLKPYHVDHDVFYKQNQEVDWVTGAAILIPKNIIKEVGGLDNSIFMYGEEVEWCFRIKKAGYKIYFTQETKIIHIGRGSSKNYSSNAFIGEFKGVIYFYKKFKSNFSLQILRILLKIGALARVFIFTLLGRSKLAKIYVEVFKMA